VTEIGSDVLDDGECVKSAERQAIKGDEFDAKLCPECHCVQAPRARECPQCGHAILAVTLVTERDGELVYLGQKARAGRMVCRVALYRRGEGLQARLGQHRALRPSLLNTQGPLIAISSPYSHRGYLWTTYSKHFGPDGNPRVLVAQAATQVMNPSVDMAWIEEHFQDDGRDNRGTGCVPHSHASYNP
jgi:hypothetical protein